MRAVMLHIRKGVEIDEGQLGFEYSSSSGPGGQHVNKASTRVTVLFNVPASDSLTENQKRRVMKKLSGRVNKQGILRISSQEHRSQHANKETSMNKLVELLRDALKRQKRRKKTRPPKWANQKRIDEKKRHGRKKHRRKMKDLPPEDKKYFG